MSPKPTVVKMVLLQRSWEVSQRSGGGIHPCLWSRLPPSLRASQTARPRQQAAYASRKQLSSSVAALISRSSHQPMAALKAAWGRARTLTAAALEDHSLDLPGTAR
jgi:hypothetical protein